MRESAPPNAHAKMPMPGDVTLDMTSFGDLYIVEPMTIPTIMQTASNRPRCARGSRDGGISWLSSRGGVDPGCDALYELSIRLFSAKIVFRTYSCTRPAKRWLENPRKNPHELAKSRL